jgi:hypothetical protein
MLELAEALGSQRAAYGADANDDDVIVVCHVRPPLAARRPFHLAPGLASSVEKYETHGPSSL